MSVARGSESVGLKRTLGFWALAFFAFIGFQDMVNVAEEVEAPERSFPGAILAALGVAGLLYVLVAAIATAVVDPRVLGSSEAPLTEVVRAASDGGLVRIFPVIALFAVANTGLLNFIMASRLLYGMADQRLLPAPLARVHASRRAPHWAIATVLLVALTLALSGSLAYLAGSTSALLLVVFLVVNAALPVLKARRRDARRPRFRVPAVVPVLGVGCTATLIGFTEPWVLATGLGLIAAGALLYTLRRALRR